MRCLESIILAAGEGKRFNSTRPKPLFEVCGQPMIEYVLNAVEEAGSTRQVVVVGRGSDQVRAELASRNDLIFLEQGKPLGTGHAVQMTAQCFESYEGEILVLAGDAPLITGATLQRLVRDHRDKEAVATILTAEIPDPSGYGRIIRSEEGTVGGIVEEKDASAEERSIQEVNSGTYCFDATYLFGSLSKVTSDNAQNEYYLTDCVRILADEGNRVEAVVTEDYREALGANDRAQLGEIEEIMRDRVLD